MLHNAVAVERRNMMDIGWQLLHPTGGGSKRGMYSCGPAGIDKTGVVNWLFKQFNFETRQKWQALDDLDKIALMPNHTRRDTHNPDTLHFRERARMVPGTVSAPAFFAKYLSVYTEHGDALALDDFRPLEKDSEVRGFIQQGLDINGNGKIIRDHMRMDEPEIHFQAAIFVNENRAYRRKVGGKKSAMELYGDAWLDRFYIVQIPWALTPRFEFITNMAFSDDKEGGLWAYLTAPRLTYPQGHHLAGRLVPENERGLGFSGSDDEAEAILTEQMDTWCDKAEMWEAISFRSVRQLIQQRIDHPDTWPDMLSMLYRKAR